MNKRAYFLNTRLGSILYWAGLACAAIGVLYAVDAVWIYDSGISLLPTAGRYMSLEEMFVAVGIGVLLALISWRAGAAARSCVNKSAEMRTGAKYPGRRRW